MVGMLRYRRTEATGRKGTACEASPQEVKTDGSQLELQMHLKTNNASSTIKT